MSKHNIGQVSMKKTATDEKTRVAARKARKDDWSSSSDDEWDETNYSSWSLDGMRSMQNPKPTQAIKYPSWPSMMHYVCK